MGFLSITSQISFKLILISYFLLFAYQLKQNYHRWEDIISANILKYTQHFSVDQIKNMLPIWAHYYTSFLVVISFFVISNKLVFKVLSCLTLVLNLVVFWTEIQILFIGLHLLTIAVILR